MKFFTIENGIVTNIIVCESLEIATEITNTLCVEATNENSAVAIGWSYVDGQFIAPPPSKAEMVLPIEELPSSTEEILDA